MQMKGNVAEKFIVFIDVTDASIPVTFYNAYCRETTRQLMNVEVNCFAFD